VCSTFLRTDLYGTKTLNITNHLRGIMTSNAEKHKLLTSGPLGFHSLIGRNASVTSTWTSVSLLMTYYHLITTSSNRNSNNEQSNKHTANIYRLQDGKTKIRGKKFHAEWPENGGNSIGLWWKKANDNDLLGATKYESNESKTINQKRHSWMLQNYKKN